MSNAPWPEGEAFVEELNQLTRASHSKITSLVEHSMRLHRHYKAVVHALEKFVRRSSRDTRLLGLFVIDALIRKSRQHFQTEEKDVYTKRFGANMILTFARLTEVRSFELPKVHKILQSWRAKNLFATDLQEEMEALYQAQVENPAPDEEENEKGGESPVAPTGERSPRDDEAKAASSHRSSASRSSHSSSSHRDSRVAASPAVRDPRRPAAPSTPVAEPNSALASLQTMLAPTSSPSSSRSFPLPPPAAAAPATVPAAAAPSPPPADMSWDYDEEDDADEDEDARKEKLRVKLEQEKTRMESIVATPVTVAPLQPQQPLPPPPSSEPRRSRFSAPKSEAEVAAALNPSSYADAPRGSTFGGGGGGERERQRSRSRSPKRDFAPRPSLDPRAGRDSVMVRGVTVANRDRPGFVILPDSYQDSQEDTMRVLSCTLLLQHATLAELDVDQNSMRTWLRERYNQFGHIESIQPKDQMSFIRFTKRKDAAKAKQSTQGQPIKGMTGNVRWAKGKDMAKNDFTNSSGEGIVPKGHASLANADIEEPSESDTDFAGTVGVAPTPFFSSKPAADSSRGGGSSGGGGRAYGDSSSGGGGGGGGGGSSNYNSSSHSSSSTYPASPAVPSADNPRGRPAAWSAPPQPQLTSQATPPAATTPAAATPQPSPYAYAQPPAGAWPPQQYPPAAYPPAFAYPPQAYPAPVAYAGYPPAAAGYPPAAAAASSLYPGYSPPAAAASFPGYVPPAGYAPVAAPQASNTQYPSWPPPQ